MSPQDEFNELSYYTLSHNGDGYFIHQLAVDAFQAQTATAETKSIGLAFGLIGLYLFLEKGYTGRQVQLAHVKLSQNKKPWPRLPLPGERGEITVSDVLAAEPGSARDECIKAWCLSVWKAYHTWHDAIASFCQAELKV
ncbi:MAG TPA: DUF5946 family protein [Cyclobacteriaceae bacterium]|nr:DUF5946 family protein [Cyclobacteriaceae bacterium]